MAQSLISRRPRSSEVIAKRVEAALAAPKAEVPEGVQPLAVGYFALESMRAKVRQKNSKKVKLRK